ncbi:hypothetical protein DVH02_12605 [Streptomyces corynorhini]|uniref:Uncharacterized protein n=1 Tax=Streptomyces corynorhini TaxID=2282652 RepID=A0A370BB12_9ACTN|nr:hypothetical protein DVH02_12605 [Streptomyces corynorhini]
MQRALRASLADRLRRARPELAERHDLASADGLAAAGAEAIAPTTGEDGDGALVAVVVRDLDLAVWARQTCAFALDLDTAAAAAWRRSFTRTVFLAGNPEHLMTRFPPARTAPDLSAAWTAPGPPAATAALRRLLKLLQADAPVPTGPDTPFEVPGAPEGPRPPGAPAVPGHRPPVRRDLYLATAGCTLSDALVHLNHVLVEAVMDGLVAPGDHLVLRRIPRLGGPPDRFAAVRAVAEAHLPGRLRAAAALSGPQPSGPE